MSVKIPGAIGPCAICAKVMPDHLDANCKYCSPKCVREAARLAGQRDAAKKQARRQAKAAAQKEMQA